MPIDRQQVQRIAELARMDLDPDELSRFSGQLQSILDYIALLDTIDTIRSLEGIDPVGPCDSAGTMGRGQAVDSLEALREDEPVPCLSSDAALVNAPDSRNGHFRVPRVLEL